MKYYTLVEPLKKRVDEIKESFYPQHVYGEGNEKLIYGTFEERYKAYSLQALRNGERVNKNNYYENAIKELESIEDSVLQIEKNIDSQDNNKIQFHALIATIHEAKKFAEEQIEHYKNKKIADKPSKARNIKSKRTYKWMLANDKLHLFKRILIKAGMIDRSISFDDFKFIFLEKQIIHLKNPIRWVSDNATHLIYFIQSLMDEGVLDKKSRKNLDYLLMVECFVKNNGEKFTEKFKSLKTDIEDNIKEDYKALIKKIILDIKA